MSNQEYGGNLKDECSLYKNIEPVEESQGGINKGA